MREENLGLGAQVGKGNAETFGLSLFSGVLGRLNGQSDEDVEKQRGALRDAELRNYQAQKYGFMNFVRGGLLVGDKMQPLMEEDLGGENGSTPQGLAQETKSQSSKKRRAEHIGEDAAQKSKKRKAEPSEQKVAKKSKNSKKPKDNETHESDMYPPGFDDDEAASLANLKSTKRKERKNKDSSTSGKAEMPSTSIVPEPAIFHSSDTAISGEDSEKISKLEKRHRKEGRRRQQGRDDVADGDEMGRLRVKEEKRARKEERRKRKEEAIKAKSTESQSDSTRPEPSTSNSQAANRLAVRRRYIQQKRMASLDPQAMKEIFMLKAVG